MPTVYMLDSAKGTTEVTQTAFCVLRASVVQLAHAPAAETEATRMWERFTERAKLAVSSAQHQALRRGSKTIDTEHLLLGLCDEPNGVATRILKKLGVDISQLVATVEDGTEQSNAEIDQKKLEFTPSAKRALELAVDELTLNYDSSLATQHLLLGLIREGESPAAKALAKANVTYDSARETAMEVLSSSAEN